MKIREKLNQVVARHDELRDILSTQTDMDSNELQRISKEFSELIDIVEIINEFLFISFSKKSVFNGRVLNFF